MTRRVATILVVAFGVLACVSAALYFTGKQLNDQIKNVRLAPPVYGPHEAHELAIAMRNEANLKLIAHAIEAYRKDHAGRIPEVPSALAPRYLATLPVDPRTGRGYAIRTPARSGAAYEIDDFNTFASFAGRPHPNPGFYYDQKSGIGYIGPGTPASNVIDHLGFGPLKLHEPRDQVEAALGQGAERTYCFNPNECSKMLEYADNGTLIVLDLEIQTGNPPSLQKLHSILVTTKASTTGVPHFRRGVPPVQDWKWGGHVPVLAIPPQQVPGWEVCDWDASGKKPEGFCGGPPPGPRSVHIGFSIEHGRVVGVEFTGA